MDNSRLYSGAFTGTKGNESIIRDMAMCYIVVSGNLFKN